MFMTNYTSDNDSHSVDETSGSLTTKTQSYPEKAELKLIEHSINF